MANISSKTLSGSTNGLAIKVVATATAGTLIHTANGSAKDEIWLSVDSSHSADVTLTLEFGGVTDPDNIIEITVPALGSASTDGIKFIVPGLILSGGLVVRAFASVANVLKISGHVVRMSSTFSPLDLANFNLWLDANGSVNHVANAVSQWDDEIDGIDNAVQGTAANQPTFNATGQNNKGTVTGGGNDFMLIPQPIPSNTANSTIFMVIKQNASDAFKVLMAWRDVAFPTRFETGAAGSGSLVFFDSGFGNHTIIPNQLSAAYSVVTITTTSTNLVTRVNGVQVSSFAFTGKTWGTAQGTDMSIFARVNGANASRHGIAALGIYLDTKNSVEISQIEVNLGIKWGITIA